MTLLNQRYGAKAEEAGVSGGPDSGQTWFRVSVLPLHRQALLERQRRFDRSVPDHAGMVGRKRTCGTAF